MLKYINSNQIPPVVYLTYKFDIISSLYSQCLGLSTCYLIFLAHLFSCISDIPSKQYCFYFLKLCLYNCGFRIHFSWAVLKYSPLSLQFLLCVYLLISFYHVFNIQLTNALFILFSVFISLWIDFIALSSGSLIFLPQYLICYFYSVFFSCQTFFFSGYLIGLIFVSSMFLFNMLSFSLSLNIWNVNLFKVFFYSSFVIVFLLVCFSLYYGSYFSALCMLGNFLNCMKGIVHFFTLLDKDCFCFIINIYKLCFIAL